MPSETLRSLVIVLAASVAASGQQPAPAPDSASAKPVVLEVAIADAAEGGSIPTAAHLRELEQAGKLRSIARYRLTLLENQAATVQFKEQVPLFLGRQSARPFGEQATYSQVNVGTIIQATAQHEEGGTLLVKLTVERSAISGEPPKPAEAGQPPAPALPQGVSSLSVQTAVQLQLGVPLVVSGRQIQQLGETSQTWIVVTALRSAGEMPPAPDGGARHQPAGPSGELRIVRLRNAYAPDVAAVLREVLALPNVPGQRLTLPPVVVADARTNALILAGPPRARAGARALAERLDDR